eukprot:355565-Chlamydomonas_euryale.AAC.2
MPQVPCMTAATICMWWLPLHIRNFILPAQVARCAGPYLLVVGRRGQASQADIWGRTLAPRLKPQPSPVQGPKQGPAVGQNGFGGRTSATHRSAQAEHAACQAEIGFARAMVISQFAQFGRSGLHVVGVHARL